MSTYRDMRQRIANELARDDLSTEIAQFIQDAIKNYQQDFFASGHAYGTASVSSGSQTVNLPTDFNSAYDVRWVRDSTSWKLEEVQRQELGAKYSQVPPPGGDPVEYAIDLTAGSPLTLILWPVPNANGTLQYRYQKQIAAPTSDVAPNDGSPGTAAAFWMNEAEPMIRSYAKFLINSQLIRDDEAAKVNAVAANEFYKSLRRRYEGIVYSAGVVPYGNDIDFGCY